MDKEKLEKMASDVRKTAVEVDRALTNAKRQKKAEEAKKKTPATSTPEGDPLEDNIEKMIGSRDTLQRAILYLRDFDYQNTFGRGLLKEGQRERLRASFRTQKQYDEFREVGLFYDKLVRYSQYLLAIRKTYQAEVANLTNLCVKWDKADELAEALTNTWNNHLLPLLREKGEAADSAEALERYVSEVWPKQMEQDGITPKVEQTGTDEEERPVFKIVADVDGEGGLYERILDAQEDATEQLIMLRSALEPFSSFTMSDVKLKSGKTIFPYTALLPQNAERILDYPDAIGFMHEPNADKYFSYRLRQRREKGEGDSITPEEEKRAVIPDYNQVEEAEEYSIPALHRLSKEFEGYFNPNKSNE